MFFQIIVNLIRQINSYANNLISHIFNFFISYLMVYCSQSKHLLLNSRPLLHLSIEYFVIVHDNDTPKAEFVSPMSKRTYTWAAQSIPDNRLPTSPSFFFPFFLFTTMLVNGLMCAELYLPSRIRWFDQAGGWRGRNAPLLFLVVSAVVRLDAR